jgi:hypothetical protein
VSQDSYDRVNRAARALREAMDEYAQARYENYRARLVAPSGAYRHAVDDLSEITNHALDDARSQLAYTNSKEIVNNG